MIRRAHRPEPRRRGPAPAGAAGRLPPPIDDLQRAAGTDIDLAVLDAAGPVLREPALVGTVALYEHRPGDWARAATAAVERMDTAWMRRLDLDLLAG